MSDIMGRIMVGIVVCIAIVVLAALVLGVPLTVALIVAAVDSWRHGAVVPAIVLSGYALIATLLELVFIVCLIVGLFGPTEAHHDTTQS